jgi:hypothetical protein
MTEQVSSSLGTPVSAIERDRAASAFARLLLTLAIFLALSGFVVLPFGMALINGRGWSSLINVMWLFLPALSLLWSLRDWLRGRRSGATSDALVSCGLAGVWLFLVVVDVARLQDYDLGLTPYLVAAGLLVFTVVAFLVFVRAMPPETSVGSASGLVWLYWTLFVTCLAVIVFTYGLSLYFQLLQG